MTVLTKLTKAELVALLKDAQDRLERLHSSFTAVSNISIAQGALLGDIVTRTIAEAAKIEGMKEQIRKQQERIQKRGETIERLERTLAHKNASYIRNLQDFARQAVERQKVIVALKEQHVEENATIVELERQLALRICEMCAIHLKRGVDTASKSAILKAYCDSNGIPCTEKELREIPVEELLGELVDGTKPAEEQFEGCPYARCNCTVWYHEPKNDCLAAMSDAAQLRWRKKIQD